MTVNAAMTSNLQDILSRLPSEPADGASPERVRESFARLQHAIIGMAAQLRAYACRPSCLCSEDDEVQVFYSRQSGYFDPAYVFTRDGAYRIVSGAPRTLVGPWRDGVRQIFADMMWMEDELARGVSESARSMSRLFATVFPCTPLAAPHLFGLQKGDA